MLSDHHSLKAEVYRRKATTCGSYAVWARSSDYRDQWLRMRDSCLALAAKEDWLDGVPPAPPAKALAGGVGGRSSNRSSFAASARQLSRIRSHWSRSQLDRAQTAYDPHVAALRR